MNMVSRSDVEIWRVPSDDSSLSCTCKPLELLQADKLKQVMCKIKPSSWLSKTSELCWGFVLVFTQLHGTYRYILAHDLPSFGRTCPFSENAFRRSTFVVRYWNGCLRCRTATVINLSVKVWDLRTWENINRHKYSNIMCHNTVLIWICFDFPILHCYWIAWGVRSWKIWKLNWTETERVKSIWRVNIYSNEQSSRARKNCNSQNRPSSCLWWKCKRSESQHCTCTPVKTRALCRTRTLAPLWKLQREKKTKCSLSPVIPLGILLIQV